MPVILVAPRPSPPQPPNPLHPRHFRSFSSPPSLVQTNNMQDRRRAESRQVRNKVKGKSRRERPKGTSYETRCSPIAVTAVVEMNMKRYWTRRKLGEKGSRDERGGRAKVSENEGGEERKG